MNRITLLITALSCAIISFAQEPELLYDFMSNGVAYKILDESTVEISPVSRTLQAYQTSDYIYTGNDVTDFPMDSQVQNETDGQWYEIVGVGAYAFYGAHLSSIDFLDFYSGRLEYIRDYAFQNCKNLKVVNLPITIQRIGAGAFEGCSALKYVAMGFSGMPSGDINIALADKAFGSATGLKALFLNNNTSLTLPDVGEAFENVGDGFHIYVPDKGSYNIQNLSRYYVSSYGEFNTYSTTYCGHVPELSSLNFSSNVQDADVSVVNANSYESDGNVGNYQGTAYVKFNFGWEYNYFAISPRLNFTYRIKPAPLFITVADSSREYGEPNPEFDISVTGYVDGEDESIFSTKPMIVNGVADWAPALPDESTPVGTYEIQAMASGADNYLITWKHGTLTINPAPLKVMAWDYYRPYGEKNPQFSVEYDGFKNAEDYNVLTEQPSVTTNAEIDSPVGEYPIIVSGGKAGNYILDYQDGVLTITKAYQHITWDQEFNNMAVGDEVTLDAQMSSGLPVSYTLYGNDNVAELDGNVIRFIGLGSVDIEVTQPGNENYHDFAMFKTAHVDTYSGIENVTNENLPNIRIDNGKIFITGAVDSDVVCVYSLSGNTIYRGTSRIIPLSHGIYIVQIGSHRQKVVIR